MAFFRSRNKEFTSYQVFSRVNKTQIGGSGRHNFGCSHFLNFVFLQMTLKIAAAHNSFFICCQKKKVSIEKRMKDAFVALFFQSTHGCCCSQEIHLFGRKRRICRHFPGPVHHFLGAANGFFFLFVKR